MSMRRCLCSTAGRTTTGGRTTVGSRMPVGSRTTVGVRDGPNLQKARRGIPNNNHRRGSLSERYDKSTMQPHPVIWTKSKLPAMAARQPAEDDNPKVAKVENPKGKAMESRQQLPPQLRCAETRPSPLPKGARRQERPETDDGGQRQDQTMLKTDEKSNVSLSIWRKRSGNATAKRGRHMPAHVPTEEQSCQWQWPPTLSASMPFESSSCKDEPNGLTIPEKHSGSHQKDHRHA